MDSTQYTDQTELTLGVIVLRSKAKRCGKPNCGQCPHHGYWYAFVPDHSAARHRRAEIYLGRQWTADDLRAKVAPALQVQPRRDFIALLDQHLRQERIAALTAEQQQVTQSIKAATARHVQEIFELRRREAAIKTELRHLHQGKTRPAPARPLAS